MALRSVRVCRDAVSKYRSSSCRAASAPSWDWQRSTGWLANRKMPSSHQCDAFEGGEIPMSASKDTAHLLWTINEAFLTLLPPPERGGAPWLLAGGSFCSSEWSWSPHTLLSVRCTLAWWSPRRSGSFLSACHLRWPRTRRGLRCPFKTHQNNCNYWNISLL